MAIAPTSFRGPGPDRRFLLGMKVDLMAPQEAVDAIASRAVQARPGYVCVTNVHACVMTRDDPAFRDAVNGADVALPDSTILRRALALRYRTPVPPGEKGADLMLRLCAAAEHMGVAVALVGGRDETVLETLELRLKEQFPMLRIAYSHSPSFYAPTEAEERALADALAASGATLIFVGLGCPKQERWMARHKPLLDAMMVGVGAAFDFNAGVVRPSPAWVHKAGLEWLYRLLAEPRRLWRRYLTTSPRFLLALALDMVSAAGSGRR